MTRLQNLAVVATCVVAAMTYAGAVTMDGMGLFLLPGVVGVALLGSFLAARRMPGTALILGGALVLGWSELVNVWSGTGAGPAARSTAVAATCSLIAVVVARSGSPALFLLPVAASVGGALMLGAGSEVRSVAVAAVVSAALTLGCIERSRRNWTARPRRGPAFALLTLLVGAIAAAVVLLQVQRDTTPPEALASGLAYPHIKPPWKDPLGSPKPRGAGAPPAASASSPPPPAKSSIPPHSRPPHTPPPPPTRHHNPPPRTKHATQPKNVSHKKQAHQSKIWLYVLAAILLVLLALSLRLLAVRLAWRRLRRRLATGAPAEQITGAWAWMRMRLDACRLPLPAAASPDVVAAGHAASDLPGDVFEPLQVLATAATTAAFASAEALDASDVSAAWTAAGRCDTVARRCIPRRTRLSLAFRGPAASLKAS